MLDVDRLVVAEAFVGKALVMKRWAARARGRVGSIEKFFSNITVIVRERASAGKTHVELLLLPSALHDLGDGRAARDREIVGDAPDMAVRLRLSAQPKIVASDPAFTTSAVSVPA